MSDAEFSFYTSVAQNFLHFNDGNDADFKASRVDAGNNYRVWRFGANYIEKLRKDWQFRSVLTGQLGNDALVSGEQFGLGGANSVRGFGEREVAKDQGFSVNLELYTPDFGDKLSWGENFKARALVFYDTGYLRQNNPQPGEIRSDSIASIGTGVRVSVGEQFSLRADYGYIINPIATLGSEDKGDSRLHVSAVYIFD
jgi:hemolysin activation/secretion protein